MTTITLEAMNQRDAASSSVAGGRRQRQSEDGCEQCTATAVTGRVIPEWSIV
ncbi:hypothetical protein [Actinopolymorpha alba]|uniref:hypothetical protein n=1 Tax=Actinopolymorpha alba TaxID=533267 RepID=UPI0003AA4A4D|nr:hypothetical protein [Actinopolymorpha alba]